MLFKAIELEKLLVKKQNNSILDELLSAIESDLVSEAADEWRLSILKKLRNAGEVKLLEKAKEELQELFFNPSLLH